MITISSERLARFRARLEVHRAQLARYCPTNTEPGFVSAMQEFLAFIGSYEDKGTYESFEKSSDFTSYQEFFSPLVLRFAWAMEELAFEAMMAHDPKEHQKLGEVVSPHVWQTYAKTEDVLNLVDVSACRNIVMTGCGKFPSTLLYLHDWTAVPCLVGIDKHPAAVDMARRLVDAFQISRMKIVQADAIDFDYADFDLIYWDAFSTPRVKVMERLLSSAKHGTVIVLREPFFAGTLLLESVLAALDSRFTVCGESSSLTRLMLKHYVIKLR